MSILTKSDERYLERIARDVIAVYLKKNFYRVYTNTPANDAIFLNAEIRKTDECTRIINQCKRGFITYDECIELLFRAIDD